MKTRILYTTRNKKAVLEESSLHEHKTYLKHIYADEVLKKTELWVRDHIESVILYPGTEEKASDEEILIANVLLRGVRIIRIRDIGEYKLVHDKSYKNFLLSKEEIYISDHDDRKTASYSTYNNRINQFNEILQNKYIYLKDGSYRELNYSEGRKPYIEKTSFEKKIREYLAGNNSSLTPDYYLDFSPFFPSGEDLELETIRYFSFYEGDEISLQEAFFEKEFHKKVYVKEVLRRTETFKNLKLSEKAYFIYDQLPFTPEKEDTNFLIDIHYLREERNGFRKWEIVRQRKGKTGVYEKEIWVLDAQGKRFFYQEIDGKSGEVILTRKFPEIPDWEYSASNSFEYDNEGKLISEGLDLYDDWNNEFYSVAQMREDGFFESEYGKYFMSALPEIPEFEESVTKIVYKNHLDEVIPEKNIKGLYEYSEEIYENERLVKIRKYTAYSSKELEEQKYHSITASYHDDVEQTPDLTTFRDDANEIYYNKKIVNNYILYDFITRDYWDGKKAEFSGTVVYDNYYRIISKVVYNALSGQLISGTKTLYEQVTPLLNRKYITVNFNRNGEVENYIDNRFLFPEYESKEKFENKHFGSGPVSDEYYQSLKELVPENQAFPFFDFVTTKMLYTNETETESEITLLMVNSKIKMATEEYATLHFLGNGESLENYLNMIPDLKVRSYLYFYNIMQEEDTIETDFYGLGISAHFSIDLSSREIACHIRDASGKNISFRKAALGGTTDIYFFYVNERKVFVNFYSELLINLLLKA